MVSVSTVDIYPAPVLGSFASDGHTKSHGC